MNAPRRMTLAFTGASGMPFGLRLLECLLGAGVQVDLVYSAPHKSSRARNAT